LDASSLSSYSAFICSFSEGVTIYWSTTLHNARERSNISLFRRLRLSSAIW